MINHICNSLFALLGLNKFMIQSSNLLKFMHSDIRGLPYLEALHMESEGTNVLKLNTGNSGRFGFLLPNSVRQSLALHIDEAVPYCDVRGMRTLS